MTAARTRWGRSTHFNHTQLRRVWHLILAAPEDEPCYRTSCAKHLNRSRAEITDARPDSDLCPQCIAHQIIRNEHHQTRWRELEEYALIHA